MTTSQLVDAAWCRDEGFTRLTLHSALRDELQVADSPLVRVRRGLVRLRDDDAAPSQGATGATALATARTHVVAAMQQLHAEGSAWVRRVEVQERLAAHGLQYSRRATSASLTELVRAGDASVQRAGFLYRLTE